MPTFRITGGTLTGEAVDSGSHPEHPIFYPPGIWGPTDPRPSHPIVIIPPDAVAPGVPTHPIYIPVYPAHPIVIPPGSVAPGVPTHPIYLPPGIWGPNDPRPTPPIVIPPGAIDGVHPEHPIYLPVYPEHPIVLPPEDKPPGTSSWQWIYTREGWALLPPGGGGKPQPVP